MNRRMEVLQTSALPLGYVALSVFQFVFLDTPGLHKARTRLGDYMVNVVKESVADVDAVMLLVEPIPNVGGPEAELIARIKTLGCPSVLVINKVDTLEHKEKLDQLLERGTDHKAESAHTAGKES